MMRDMESTVVLLALLGFLAVLLLLVYTTVTVVQGIRAHFTANTIPLTKTYGEWAVVTGSTDGIGRAYAYELAKRGLNIVLISRTQEKLDRVATELRQQFFVRTKTIAADYSRGSKVMDCIEKELSALDVGILVNNVGKQYDYPMLLTEVAQKDLWAIININIGATTQMTRLVLPGMVKRGRGAIVNVSSGSEAQPLPLMTVYAATKTFVKSFSAALRCEYASKGITVQHVAPLFVNTKMNNFSERLQRSTWLVPDAATYAREAVNTLGRLDVTAGCWSHEIQAFFISFTPVMARTYIGWTLNSILRNDYNTEKKLKDCSR